MGVVLSHWLCYNFYSNTKWIKPPTKITNIKRYNDLTVYTQKGNSNLPEATSST